MSLMPPRPELYLALRETLAGHLLLGAAFHGPQRPQLVRPERTAPDSPGRLLDELAAEVRPAGGRPGLQQGLELPGLRPSVPVRRVRGEAADQRAGAALRAQRQVGAPGLTDQTDKALRVASADQDDVDIAAVVELACAQLAHGHHGQLVGEAAGLCGRRQHPVGQVGQQPPHGLERDPVGKVEGGDPQHLEGLPTRQRLQRPDRLVEGGQDVQSHRVGHARAGEERAGCHHGHDGLQQRAGRLQTLHRLRG